MTVDRALDRRRFLQFALAGAAVLAPAPGWAMTAKLRERRLSFYNLHTDENLTATYWADGAYVPEGLAEIDRMLRDFRTGDVAPIDRRLLDLLRDLAMKLDSRQPFHVISGYRSPATNAVLASASSGVAKHSLHTRGMAIDIRVPGRPLKDLRQAAISLRTGGVGYYPASDFVHVDVGRVRTW